MQEIKLMNTRELIFSFILLVLAAGLWQLLKEEDPALITHNLSQEAIPGYYLNTAEFSRYNKNGQLEYTINAEKIEQDLASNNLNLSNIQVNYHAQGNWTVKADSAVLPASRENISFSGNVVAAQNSADKTSFNSNSLNYNIANQILSTQDSIRAIKGQQVITAKGMTLDMKNERIKLLSQVKIRFLP